MNRRTFMEELKWQWWATGWEAGAERVHNGSKIPFTALRWYYFINTMYHTIRYWKVGPKKWSTWYGR